MARTHKLTDGTIEISLINTASPGIIANRGGLGKNTISANQTFSSSPLTDGANLRLKSYPPVVERYVLNLKATSQDNAASQLQALDRLLRKADNLQLTQWQQAPVYLQSQATNETNARYATVIAWSSQDLTDYFNQPFEVDHEMDEFEISIAREPFWRSTAPGTLSSLEAFRTPDFPYFDSETIGGDGAINITGAAAQSGDWGAAITLADSGSETFGTVELADTVTDFSVEFDMNADDLTMDPSGDIFVVLKANGGGPGGRALRLSYRDVSGQRKIKQQPALDGGTEDGALFDLPAGVTTIKIEWGASSAPGLDNGESKMYFDDVLKETLSDLDNDQHDVTDFDIGGVSDVDDGTSGDLYFDNISYSTSKPLGTPTRTIDFEQTLPFVSNYRQTTVLSHIFNEDDSEAAFSSNLLGVPAFPLFEVSGSTPALDDAIYFGADGPFYHFVLNITTQGSASVGFLLEYWDGGSWVNTGSLLAQIFSMTGHMSFVFEGKSDWATTTVNGVADKYWLRIRITSFSSWTTSPAQGDEIVYLPNDTYVEINNLQILGDVPALGLQRFLNYTDAGGPISWMAVGQKSRGLTNFTSRLNAGGQNPAGWTETYGTDTSKVADTIAPGGNNATVTFSTATLVQRLLITNKTGAAIRDFEGTYRIYMRATQVGGSAGDVSVQLRIRRGLVIIGETVPLKQADERPELLDMGIFSIIPEQFFPSENDPFGAFAGVLQFQIYAKSDNGSTPNLEIHDLILMPIDEAAMVTSWSARAFQAMDVRNIIQIDSGILREKTTEMEFADPTADVYPLTPLSTWETRGALMTYEPQREARLYYLFGFNGDNNFLESDQGAGGGIQLYLHEQWFGLRGADG